MSEKKFSVLSVAQRTALVSGRAVSGSLSAIASAILIRKILCRKDRTTYHRIVGGLSVVDLLYSFWSALATLPVPPDTGAIGAHGTLASCIAQGTFAQLGSVTPVYMMSLSLFFLLSITSGKKDSDRIVKKYEPFLHAIPLFVMGVTCITGLVLEVFNPVGLPEYGCWLGEYPQGCTRNGSTPCRGKLMTTHHTAIVWAFASGPLFSSFFVILVANLWINKTIRDQEKRNKSYTNTAVSTHFLRDTDETPEEVSIEEHESIPASGLQSMRNKIVSARRQKSIRGSESSSKVARAAAFQSCLYVFFASMTMIWQFLPWVFFQLQVNEQDRFYVNMGSSLIFPLQGVFNLLVYIRPRYLRHRKEQADVSRFKLMVKSLCEAP